MANNMSSRQACHAARYVVARVLRGLFWCLKYTVILPLATMALMALFVLWKDNTTPGKLLVKEINFVRQTAPAGQFPVSECWFSSSDSSGRSEIQDICHYRAADAADYVRETDRSLMQLVRSRLDEMIVLLDQYTANGTYGQYFNSDEPSLRDDAKMVVLELGGLEDRPSLLVAVMFSLIIYIENRMYRTPRNLKKLNVIDEGWRLLDFKNHKVGEFIEKGYRTARRHTGAYITITQNIVDFDSDKASSAARAAWGNSSYKIILKQSAKEFAKYNQLYPDWRSADYPGF